MSDDPYPPYTPAGRNAYGGFTVGGIGTETSQRVAGVNHGDSVASAQEKMQAYYDLQNWSRGRQKTNTLSPETIARRQAFVTFLLWSFLVLVGVFSGIFYLYQADRQWRLQPGGGVARFLIRMAYPDIVLSPVSSFGLTGSAAIRAKRAAYLCQVDAACQAAKRAEGSAAPSNFLGIPNMASHALLLEAQGYLFERAISEQSSDGARDACFLPLLTAYEEPVIQAKNSCNSARHTAAAKLAEPWNPKLQGSLLLSAAQLLECR